MGFFMVGQKTRDQTGLSRRGEPQTIPPSGVIEATPRALFSLRLSRAVLRNLSVL